jgi:surface protein
VGTFTLDTNAQPNLFKPVDDGGLGLYFPYTAAASDDSGEVGQVKLCTRVEYKMDYRSNGDIGYDSFNLDGKKDSISILDTNYIIDIDLNADFSTFDDTAVQIFKRSNTIFNTEASAAIDVVAYICDDSNAIVTPSSDIGDGKFTDGQDFRICVKPTDENGFYSIEKFVSITCSNDSETRQIVVDGKPDALTILQKFSDDNGYGGTYSAFGSLAFTSVVTSGFLNPVAAELQTAGTTSYENGVQLFFSCSGEVELSVNNDANGNSYNNEVFTPPTDCVRECDVAGARGTDTMDGDTTAIQFQAAVEAYISDPINSPYGNVMNCWDVSAVQNMGKAFRYMKTFNEPLNCWDTGSVTAMNDMFGGAHSFNNDISEWNVGSVTIMTDMFRQAFPFNKDISKWNVGSVTDMSSMFRSASSFNNDISEWNVESVTTMSKMFRSASSFNNDISEWDVGSVIEMSGMFSGANSFNKNISVWNVESVTDMSTMFSGANSFNKNISVWNVGSVTDMSSMFEDANSFNKNISGWNVGSVTDMSSMFEDANSFNKNISKWNVGSVADMSSMFKDAEVFNQYLCDWGDLLLVGTNTERIFDSSGCDIKYDDPAWSGNWCQVCDSRRLVVDDDRNAHKNNINKLVKNNNNNNNNNNNVHQRSGLTTKGTFSTSTKASSINGSINNNSIERKIQEVEENSPFAVAIELGYPTSNESSSSSSSYGQHMSIFGAVIGSAAVIAALL